MIAIIDYGLGNLHSVYNAFNYLGYETIITNDENIILNADKVVLPGVGAFPDAMKTILKNKLDIVIKKIINKKTPLLGICLGMQLLFEQSEEHEICNGLGILKGKIVAMKDLYQDGHLLKIPHIGWNLLEINKNKTILKDLKDPYVYFVHSYYLETNEDIVSSYINYGKKIAVSVEKDNIYATQFHPEKSGEIGLKILRNFGEL